MRLYQYGLLNKGQTKLFAKNLWSRVDEKGFPKDTNYYYSAWLNYPHPGDIDPEQLFRYYINTEPFHIENKREGNGVGFNNGDLPLLINIANTGKGGNANVYTWSRYEINNLIPKLKEWWDEDKKYLKDKEISFMPSVSDEFEKRFKHMIEIFQYVIKANIALVDKANISLIEAIVDDLRNHDFPDLQLKASLLALFPKIEKELGEQIVENLCSKNKKLIYDAINASIMLNKDEGHYDTTDIVCVIGDNILCRTDVALSWFLDGIGVILKDRPTAFSENILRKLEIGITALLTENTIINADTQEVVHNKLSIRTSITRLVPILISYFVAHRKEVPKYLSEWEKQLTDENEFVDITNMFLENRAII